jgi:hypothetical protein
MAHRAGIFRKKKKIATHRRENFHPSLIKSKGFYWVRVKSNSRIDTEHWEPAYFTGDDIDGWGLCGQDPVLKQDCFIDIKPMKLPK